MMVNPWLQRVGVIAVLSHLNEIVRRVRRVRIIRSSRIGFEEGLHSPIDEDGRDYIARYYTGRPDGSGLRSVRSRSDRGPRSIAFERIPNACRAAGVNGVRRRCCGVRVVDLMDSGEQASARVGEISVQLSRRWNIITSEIGRASCRERGEV